MVLELAIVLVCLGAGARLGGAGLGAISGLGTAVLVFGFELEPGDPPVDVLFMIISVVAAASALQAAGGLDYMVHLASRALHAYPRHVTLVAPAIAYLFTFCMGTGHVVYALLPVIAETARKAGVRPERPMSVSVIASQQAITASPISAATVSMLGLVADGGIGLAGILIVCVPGTFVGCMLAALTVYRRGRELHEELPYEGAVDEFGGAISEQNPRPVLSQRERVLKLDGNFEPSLNWRARGSVVLFLLAVSSIVALGFFDGLRPWVVDEKTERLVALPMAQVVEIVMLSTAGLLVLAFGASPTKAAQGSIARAGAIAVLVIFGVSLLGNTFFDANKNELIGPIRDVVADQPWVFALALFALSVMLFSQGATVNALMPIGKDVGLPGGDLVAMFPAVNGNFFLPAYGTVVAAIALDPTGTTRVGRYLLNHSFMLPGLVATTTAVAIGFLLSRILL